jgi:signal transduction histidine kinase
LTPPGGVSAVQVEVDGDKVHLHVKDSGPGIPHHEQTHIFEPFYRIFVVA